MTEKLYYQDSHRSTFHAKVLSCEQRKDGYQIALDRTTRSRWTGLYSSRKAAASMRIQAIWMRWKSLTSMKGTE